MTVLKDHPQAQRRACLAWQIHVGNQQISLTVPVFGLCSDK